MQRVIGFALFFIGIGMVVGLLAPQEIITFLIAAIFLLLGYNLFCGC